jgi:uncharacterized protein
VTFGEAALVLVAGFGAGVVNGAAGGGTMVSFPALLALGYESLTANVTSAVGILPGYLGGVAGYRTELQGQRRRVRMLLPASVAGALTGALLLLVTPEDSFDVAVPWLILAACGLFALQPVLARRVAAARRRQDGGDATALPGAPIGWGMHAGTYVGAVYGGYFGAGLGVVLLAVLGIGIHDSLIRINGLRGVLALAVNCVAVLAFLVAAPVAWGPTGLLAISSLVGGWLGARGARRLPTPVLRALVVALGLIAAGRLLLT